MATTTQPITQNRPEQPPQKRDFRQEVTDSIVQMLEKGVAPWQKPWEASASAFGMPMNPTTEKAYRGGNAIHLIATGLRRGYEDPRWMTYKQAAENGWQVRKGEKGTQIEFWEIKQGSAKSSTANPSGGESGSEATRRAEERQFIHRVYTVFNAKQIDGVSAHQPKQHSAFDAVRAGEQILENSGAKIIHDQADRAFYSRAEDSIHLPSKDTFKDAPGYYGTSLHELAHWSGHPSRLNRSTLAESYRFGDVNYAREELRAELASVFLAAERGIPHNPEQHAAYVGSWIKSLKEDKNEIFRAAHDASVAADFLLGLERDRSIADESLQASPTLNDDSGSFPAVSDLEQETAQLERDREQQDGNRLEQTPADSAEVTTGDIGRESLNYTARFEPGSGRVNIHDKQNATDRTLVVNADPTDAAREPPGRQTRNAALAKSDKPFSDEHAITTAALGNDARTYPAQLESGTYRGKIIGETAGHVVQRVSSRSAVAHPKDALDRQPMVGENVFINYSTGKAVVGDVHQRTRDREFAR
jgi:antirestriction protein ArdC